MAWSCHRWRLGAYSSEPSKKVGVKMRKKRWVVMAALLAGILLLYNFPVAQPSFEQVYHAVDENTRQSLTSFRNRYPVKQLKMDGFVWRYVCLGRGTETILFLHGMSGAYDIWWQQLMDFKADARVLSITYPPVKSLQAITQGIMAVLKTEGITSVHLVGSSLGVRHPVSDSHASAADQNGRIRQYLSAQ